MPNTLTEAALEAHAQSRARTARIEADRRARIAGEMAARLEQWTADLGLTVSPRPERYPFQWQGYWFDAALDGGELELITLYGFDTEDGWMWHPVHSLADIGEVLAAWEELTPDEKLIIARSRAIDVYLPDQARALRELPREVTVDAEALRRL